MMTKKKKKKKEEELGVARCTALELRSQLQEAGQLTTELVRCQIVHYLVRPHKSAQTQMRARLAHSTATETTQTDCLV